MPMQDLAQPSHTQVEKGSLGFDKIYGKGGNHTSVIVNHVLCSKV